MLKKIICTMGIKTRKHFPYPKFTAILFGIDIPDSYIKGRKSGLHSPESVVFSSSYDLMAICNQGSHSITLYDRDESKKSRYADTPVLSISDPKLLDLVHDAAFTPDGDYLVAVAREAHAVSMYQLNQGSDGRITSKLTWSHVGSKSEIYFPAGVAIHPSGKLLAVANRMKSGISLYRGSGTKGEFDSMPFQMRAEEDLNGYNLSAPHGFDFSPDGRYLAVAHKQFFKTKDPKGDSALSIFALEDDPGEGLKPDPVCTVSYGRELVHLVAFNPFSTMVALVMSQSGVDLYQWRKEQRTLQKIGEISLFNGNIGEGPKGISFSEDGKQIFVTTEFNEVLVFNLNRFVTLEKGPENMNHSA